MTAALYQLHRVVFGALVYAYGVMWVGGILAYIVLGSPPSDARWTAPVFLLLAGLIVLITARRSEFAALLAAGGFGFAAEALGVRFGFLFGKYEYTATLTPHWLGVPLVMMSAWMVLVAYLWQMTRAISASRPLRIAIASLWMTAIDLVIDPPAAGQLDYWHWFDSGAYYGIPAHNFLGWLVVSLALFSLIAFLHPDNSPNYAARYTGLSIVIFFTVIAFALGLWLAGGIGALLCGLHLLLSSPKPQVEG